MAKQRIESLSEFDSYIKKQEEIEELMNELSEELGVSREVIEKLVHLIQLRSRFKPVTCW